MPTNLETLMIRIEADTATARRELDKLQATTNSTATSVTGQFSKIQGSVQAMAAGAAVALAAFVVSTGKAAIDAASDFAEMESKFNIVFGDMSESVKAWAEELANRIGRFRGDLMGMAAELQDTFVPFGMARQEAAELSKKLVELAVDVASFNNKADADVMRDFQSALVGNTETVRKYGIVITEAVLDAKLLAMGIKGGADAASEAEKVQARFTLITQGSADAMGDAERTAGGYANTSKRLSSKLDELSVALGQRLMPEAQKVLEWLVTVVTKLNTAMDAVDRFKEANLGLMRVLYQLSELGPGVALTRGRLMVDMEAAGKEFDAMQVKQGKDKNAFFDTYKPQAMGIGYEEHGYAPSAKTPPKATKGAAQPKTIAQMNMENMNSMNSAFKLEDVDYLKDFNAEQERGDTAHADFMARSLELQEQAHEVGMSDKELIQSRLELEKASLDTMGKTLGISQEIIDQMKANLDTIANENMANLVEKTDAWADSLNSALQNAILSGHGFLKVLEQMLLKWALFGKDGKGGLLGGILGGLTKGISGALGGMMGFAAGGKPPVGRPSIVGEEGPEIFVPDASGTIIPNGGRGMGGGAPTATVEQHLHFDVGLEAVEDRIRRVIPIASAHAQQAILKSARQNREQARR